MNDLDGAVGGVPAQGTDLRNSVNSLLDAMRDLLGNLQLPEVRVRNLVARNRQPTKFLAGNQL